MGAASEFLRALRGRGSRTFLQAVDQRSTMDPEDRVFVAVDPATPTASVVVVLQGSTDGPIRVLGVVDAEGR